MRLICTVTSRSENVINSKQEQKDDSLPLLGLDPATFGTLKHRSRLLRQFCIFNVLSL
jgi:hypothetical protein